MGGVANTLDNVSAKAGNAMAAFDPTTKRGQNTLGNTLTTAALAVGDYGDAAVTGGANDYISETANAESQDANNAAAKAKAEYDALNAGGKATGYTTQLLGTSKRARSGMEILSTSNLLGS